MTTETRAAEADQASIAFQLALTQIGVGTVQEAMSLWANVPPTARVSTSAAWLRRAITMVMTRRRMSRDLARSYYRLARALRTGTTVADPYDREPTYITLDVLREEFADLAGATDLPQKGSSDDGPIRSTDDDSDRILVEKLPGLAESEERIEREAEDQLRTVLEILGPQNLEKKIDGISDRLPAEVVDRLRDEAHMQAGGRQAAAAERVAMDGGRSTMWNHMNRDKRVRGYIRLSRSGTPCGWCAMLISRGAVYRTQEKAGPSLADVESGNYADGDKYHDNCHCYAEPVYSREEFKKSSLYELNRKYEELWPEVTKGHSGKDALSVWRKYIREQSKATALEAG